MENFFKRISINKNVCHGKPHIRNSRIMVEQVLDLLAKGATPQEIIDEDFPDLILEDIKACIAFANQLVRDEKIIVFESQAVEAF